MSADGFDYLVVLDFEATCDDGRRIQPQEVIEFPSVLLSMESLRAVDEFSSFVRPHHHPVLTSFCKELTGITQAQVDDAPGFAEVLESHIGWLRSHGLPVARSDTGPGYSLVLCGDWDLATMFPDQCRCSVPPIDVIPKPYRSWVNIKRPFAQWSGRPKAPGMRGMLRALDLELTGHHHRGIDDCRNIAKIVRALVENGQRIETTTRLNPSRHPSLAVVLRQDGVSHEVRLEKRLLAPLLGKASGLFKQRVTRLLLPDGEELRADEDLLDVVSGTELTACGD